MFLHLNASFAYVNSRIRICVTISITRYFSPRFSFGEPVILAVDRNSRRHDTRHYKNTRVQRVLGGIAGSHYFSPVTPDYRSSRYVLDDKCSRHSLSRGYMCSTRYIRAHAKRHYNAPGSSLFRIAYTLDTFSPLLPFPFFFASISP